MFLSNSLIGMVEIILLLFPKILKKNKMEEKIITLCFITQTKSLYANFVNLHFSQIDIGFLLKDK